MGALVIGALVVGTIVEGALVVGAMVVGSGVVVGLTGHIKHGCAAHEDEQTYTDDGH